MILQQGGEQASPEGKAARARHQLLTCGDVTPVRRAKAAWLTSARTRRAANSVARRARMAALL
jgi:hypothetical protein